MTRSLRTMKRVVQDLGFDVLMQVACEIFKYDNNKMTKKDQEIKIKVTDEDQQFIHYVAGYIIIALPNNYKCLCENSKTFERYSFVSGDIEGKKYRGI